MDLLKNIIADLEDNKAIDIVSLDVTKKTSITDFIVFATGTSSRHIYSISRSIYEKLKKDGFKNCLLYTSPSPRDVEESRMPSSA